MNKRSRTVILGGGFAGVITARSLVKKGYKGEIVLVDQSEIHTYTPWLYEIASGMLLAKKPVRFSALRRVCGISFKELVRLWGTESLRFKQAEVIGCDFETRHVQFKDGGTLSYDNLVIALGSESAYYGIIGLKEHAFTMNSIDKVVRLRAKLNRLITELKSGQREQIKIVVGGAGATGCELAAELANCLNKCAIRGELAREKIRIVLIEASDRVLSSAGRSAQEKALKRLKQIGVEVHLKTMIVKTVDHYIKIAPTDDKLNESKMKTDLIIWTGGIQSIKVIENFKLNKDPRGRIKVNESFEVENQPGVFALGDICSLIDQNTKRALPALAQVAIKEAKLTAINIIKFEERAPLKKFKFVKHWIVVIPMGGRVAIADFGRFSIGGLFAHLLRALVDLRYFMQLTPAGFAIKKWWQAERLMDQNN